MPKLGNTGGRLNGSYQGALTGAIARTCPTCQAAPGWRCTKTTGQQVLPRVKFHPER